MITTWLIFLIFHLIKLGNHTNSTFKHYILGTVAIKFALPYACIFMNYIEREFLKSEQIQSWIWFKYIDDIFFICIASEKELD